ncbi:hypothetical protein C8Q73DRAFT_368006 [Cubamyces lactineus]|nr:hypothetical protein C8Q73DRAFT_368006 [Cubamyces lactineus]
MLSCNPQFIYDGLFVIGPRQEVARPSRISARAQGPTPAMLCVKRPDTFTARYGCDGSQGCKFEGARDELSKVRDERRCHVQMRCYLPIQQQLSIKRPFSECALNTPYLPSRMPSIRGDGRRHILSSSCVACMAFISALRVRPVLRSCQDRSVPILRKPPCISPPPHSSQTSTDHLSLLVSAYITDHGLTPSILWDSILSSLSSVYSVLRCPR